MSTTLAPSATTGITTRPFHIPNWVAALAASAATIGLAVWLLVALSSTSSTTSDTPRPVTHVQPVGPAGQNNQLCAPAPNMRYC